MPHWLTLAGSTYSQSEYFQSQLTDDAYTLAPMPGYKFGYFLQTSRGNCAALFDVDISDLEEATWQLDHSLTHNGEYIQAYMRFTQARTIPELINLFEPKWIVSFTLEKHQECNTYEKYEDHNYEYLYPVYETETETFDTCEESTAIEVWLIKYVK